MTKICHITSVHNSNDVRILKKECVSLAKNNSYEVFLVGPGTDYEYENVKVVGCGNIPSSRLDRMVKFSKFVIKKALEIDADIYHLHDPELLRYVKLLKKNGGKVIFDSHENVLDSIKEKTYLPSIARIIFRKYFEILQKKIMPKLDGIIIVTPQMRELYEKYNDNIALIANYPFLSKSTDSEPKDDVVQNRFIFAGGVTPQWSHKEIIQAIEEIEDVKYYIYGPADEQYLSELKELKGWDKVHYGGKISFEKVQEEIKKSQFAFALLKGGNNTFGKEGTLGNTKLFETMGNGKPVIASDFNLWKEIIEKYNCGICVDPNDISEIRKSIEAIINKTEFEYEKISNNCREIIKNKYNWEVEEKNLILFYEKMINERSSIA